MSSSDQAVPPADSTDVATKVPEKITLRLTPDARMALDWIAAKKGVTLGEVIRQAISHEKFLTEEVERGGTILIEGRDGRLKQLVFT